MMNLAAYPIHYTPLQQLGDYSSPLAWYHHPVPYQSSFGLPLSNGLHQVRPLCCLSWVMPQTPTCTLSPFQQQPIVTSLPVAFECMDQWSTAKSVSFKPTPSPTFPSQTSKLANPVQSQLSGFSPRTLQTHQNFNSAMNINQLPRTIMLTAEEMNHPTHEKKCLERRPGGEGNRVIGTDSGTMADLDSTRLNRDETALSPKDRVPLVGKPKDYVCRHWLRGRCSCRKCRFRHSFLSKEEEQKYASLAPHSVHTHPDRTTVRSRTTTSPGCFEVEKQSDISRYSVLDDKGTLYFDAMSPPGILETDSLISLVSKDMSIKSLPNSFHETDQFSSLELTVHNT